LLLELAQSQTGADELTAPTPGTSPPEAMRSRQPRFSSSTPGSACLVPRMLDVALRQHTRFDATIFFQYDALGAAPDALP